MDRVVAVHERVELDDWSKAHDDYLNQMAASSPTMALGDSSGATGVA